MLGFIELFLAWLVLACWGTWLASRARPARGAYELVFLSGVGLGVCVIGSFYGIWEALSTVAPPPDPTVPSRPPAVGMLEVSIWGAHAVVGVAYIVLFGITAAWLTRRAPDPSTK